MPDGIITVCILCLYYTPERFRATSKFLFLGFGLSDPDIDNMLERLASIFSRTNEAHFALVPEGRFSGLEKRRLALDKRIRVIEYENSDGTHSQVFEFLSYLYDLTAPAGALRQEYNQKIEELSNKETPSTTREVSVMVIHAGEDKEFVRKLATDMQQNGIGVWFDEWTIQIGDSLVARINEGIRSADYAIVVLSEAFFGKQWPQKELAAATLRESESQRSFVLPVVLDVSHNQIVQHSPVLASRKYLDFGASYDNALAELLRFFGADKRPV